MRTCTIAFAGGMCGPAMVRAADALADRCQRERLSLSVQYVDLWVSDYLRPNVDLVVEMFPYYKNLAIPVVNGRPFVIKQGEGALLSELVELVRGISQK